MRSIQKRKGVPLKRRGALNSPGPRMILMATLVGLFVPVAIADESKIGKKLAKEAPLFEWGQKNVYPDPLQAEVNRMNRRPNK